LVVRVVFEKSSTSPKIYEDDGSVKTDENGCFRVFLHPGSRYVIGAATKSEVGESSVVRLSEGEHRVGLRIRVLPNPPDARRTN